MKFCKDSSTATLQKSRLELEKEEIQPRQGGVRVLMEIHIFHNASFNLYYLPHTIKLF